MSGRGWYTLGYCVFGIGTVGVLASGTLVVKDGLELSDVRQEMVRIVRENDGSIASEDDRENLSLEQWVEVYERADVDVSSNALMGGRLILPYLSGEDMRRIIGSYKSEAGD